MYIQSQSAAPALRSRFSNGASPVVSYRDIAGTMAIASASPYVVRYTQRHFFTKRMMCDSELSKLAHSAGLIIEFVINSIAQPPSYRRYLTCTHFVQPHAFLFIFSVCLCRCAVIAQQETNKRGPIPSNKTSATRKRQRRTQHKRHAHRYYERERRSW
jgi:hypothetical protein